MVRNAAKECNVPLFEGVYCISSGPTYETYPEAKYYERLGAGALGMSTVPEIMTANALGLNTVAISMITNLASFLSPVELADEDVRDASKKALPNLRAVLLNVIGKIQPNPAQKKKILDRFRTDQVLPPELPITPVLFSLLIIFDNRLIFTYQLKQNRKRALKKSLP